MTPTEYPKAPAPPWRHHYELAEAAENDGRMSEAIGHYDDESREIDDFATIVYDAMAGAWETLRRAYPSIAEADATDLADVCVELFRAAGFPVDRDESEEA